jgi:hypothetical protein
VLRRLLWFGTQVVVSGNRRSVRAAEKEAAGTRIRVLNVQAYVCAAAAVGPPDQVKQAKSTLWIRSLLQYNGV